MIDLVKFCHCCNHLAFNDILFMIPIQQQPWATIGELLTSTGKSFHHDGINVPQLLFKRYPPNTYMLQELRTGKGDAVSVTKYCCNN